MVPDRNNPVLLVNPDPLQHQRFRMRYEQQVLILIQNETAAPNWKYRLCSPSFALISPQ